MKFVRIYDKKTGDLICWAEVRADKVDAYIKRMPSTARAKVIEL